MNKEETFTCDEMPDESAGAISVMPSLPMPKLTDDCCTYIVQMDSGGRILYKCPSCSKSWKGEALIADILAESARRGIEQGKREALEEVKSEIYAWQGWTNWWDDDNIFEARKEIAKRFKDFFDNLLESKLSDLRKDV